MGLLPFFRFPLALGEWQKGRPSPITRLVAAAAAARKAKLLSPAANLYKYWWNSWPSPSSVFTKPAPFAPPSHSPSTSDLPTRSRGGGATGSGLVFSFSPHLSFARTPLQYSPPAGGAVDGADIVLLLRCAGELPSWRPLFLVSFFTWWLAGCPWSEIRPDFGGFRSVLAAALTAAGNCNLSGGGLARDLLLLEGEVISHTKIVWTMLVLATQAL